MTAVSLSGNAAVQTLGLIFRTWTSQKCRELQVQEKERQTNAQYHTDRNAGIRKNYAGKNAGRGTVLPLYRHRRCHHRDLRTAADGTDRQAPVSYTHMTLPTT